jgi:hypothetical protein
MEDDRELGHCNNSRIAKDVRSRDATGQSQVANIKLLHGYCRNTMLLLVAPYRMLKACHRESNDKAGEWTSKSLKSYCLHHQLQK